MVPRPHYEIQDDDLGEEGIHQGLINDDALRTRNVVHNGDNRDEADDDDDDEENDTFRRRFGCERWPLHYACRVGNLENVKYLLSVMKVDIDEQDDHDATPLYLAALTGRTNICRYLLENGATCDPDSGGDAARVFYVALTPELRRLLREWSLTAASRDAFLDLIPRLYNDDSHADTICHGIGMENPAGEIDSSPPIYVHHCIVTSRCPALATYVKRLDTDQEEKILAELVLPTRFRTPAMRQLMEYIYTGIFETASMESAMDFRQIATDLGLESVRQKLDAILDDHEPKRRFHCICSEEDCVKLDMARLAADVSKPHAEVEDMDKLSDMVQWSDTTVQCLQDTWSLHAAILCAHSSFFVGALQGHFRESQDGVVDLSQLVPCPEAVRWAIQWMYCDQFLLNDEDDVPSLEVAGWILELGSILPCPRLNQYVANTVLIPEITVDNALDLLELALVHSLDRLEDKCVEIMALDLVELVLPEDRRTQIVTILSRDAEKIIQRGDEQVTDVPIAAEMKSIIQRQRIGEERQHQLELLQDILRDALASQ